MKRGAPFKRQFIAGAVCPSCAAIDKVRRCEDAAAIIWLECIACGYTQDLTSGYVDFGEKTAPVAAAPGAGTAKKIHVLPWDANSPETGHK